MQVILTLLLLVLTGLLPAQGITDVPVTQIEMGQMAGLQIITNDRTFSSLTTQNKILALSLDYPLLSGSTMIMSAGINKHKLITADGHSNDLIGKIGWYAKGEISYRIGIFYGRAATLIYKTKGEITEYVDQNTSYLHDNNYTFIEYPVETGIYLTINVLEMRAGILKTYLYGTNEKSVKLIYANGTSDLGTKKYSFIDQLPFALTTGIRYKLTPLYSLQVDADLYSAKKYQFVFSIWSKVAQTARL